MSKVYRKSLFQFKTEDTLNGYGLFVKDRYFLYPAHYVMNFKSAYDRVGNFDVTLVSTSGCGEIELTAEFIMKNQRVWVSEEVAILKLPVTVKPRPDITSLFVSEDQIRKRTMFKAIL